MPTECLRAGARRIAIAGALGALAAHCSFDLEYLRRNRDAQADAQPDEPAVEDAGDEPAFDAPSPDARDTAPPTDARDAADGSDAADTTPPIDVPRCDFPSEIVDIESVGTPLNPATSTGAAPWGYLVHGRTEGESLVSPPASCIRTPATQVAPERIYRYIVRQGPTLVASTEAPLCRTTFDTIVTLLRECPTVGTLSASLACNDDSARLTAPANCYSPPMAVDGGMGVRDTGARDAVADAGEEANSARYTSSAVATDLSPGDVVYIVVDGWSDESGSFRLQVAENAARIGPSVPTSAEDPRCECTTNAPRGTTYRLTNVNSQPTVSVSRATQYAQFGLNVPALTNVIGLSARLKLTEPFGSCSTTPTFDIGIRNSSNMVTRVASFEVDGSTPRVTPRTNGVFIVPFQSFSSVSVLAGDMGRLIVSLRNDIPGECSSVTFDVTAPENEVTLYTQ